MKVQIVAKNAGEVERWLRRQCLVKGHIMLCFRQKVRRWHDDIIPLNAALGNVCNVYDVCLRNDCQAHLTEWERGGVTILEDGVQYICPRSAEVVACPI